MSRDDEQGVELEQNVFFRPTAKNYSVNQRGEEIAKYCEVLLEEASAFQAKGKPEWLSESLDPDIPKRQLFEALKSENSETVKEAIYELTRRGWLQDGTLKSFIFEGINLPKVVFSHADLSGVNFSNANLEGAYFHYSKLDSVNFSNAKLNGIVFNKCIVSQANFERTDLQSCWLSDDLKLARFNNANLEGGVIAFTDLQKASFERANLKDSWFIEPVLYSVDFFEANLYKTVFYMPKVDQQIRLPDGTMYQPFNLKQNLGYYTDPSHPLFWAGFKK